MTLKITDNQYGRLSYRQFGFLYHNLCTVPLNVMSECIAYYCVYCIINISLYTERWLLFVQAPAVESHRLPRPRSAIVTRESAMDSSTTATTATAALLSTARDDVVTTPPAAGNLLAVPSSWYRTEVAANVGPAGSRRLMANVQLGVPPSPATTTSQLEVTTTTAVVAAVDTISVLLLLLLLLMLIILE